MRTVLFFCTLCLLGIKGFSQDKQVKIIDGKDTIVMSNGKVITIDDKIYCIASNSSADNENVSTIHLKGLKTNGAMIYIKSDKSDTKISDDVEFYLDDKKIDKEKIKDINTEEIKNIKVEKNDNKQEIRLYTK